MLTITPATKLRFQAITDVDIPEGWALRLDTPTMNHNGDDTPGIAMYVGEPQEYGGWFEEHDVVRVVATGNEIRAQKGWCTGSCRLTSTCVGAPQDRFKRC